LKLVIFPFRTLLVVPVPDRRSIYSSAPWCKTLNLPPPLVLCRRIASVPPSGKIAPYPFASSEVSSLLLTYLPFPSSLSERKLHPDSQRRRRSLFLFRAIVLHSVGRKVIASADPISLTHTRGKRGVIVFRFFCLPFGCGFPAGLASTNRGSGHPLMFNLFLRFPATVSSSHFFSGANFRMSAHCPQPLLIQ